MKIGHLLAALAPVVLLVPETSIGQEVHEPPGFSLRADSLGIHVDRFVREAMRQMGAVPGLSVAVVRADTVLLEQAWGYRDQVHQLPVTTSTGFYIASATKSYVGLLTALLDHAGLVSLDAPLTRCLPDLDLNGTVSPDSNSLRDLLRHTRGWENDAVNIRRAYTDFLDARHLQQLLADYTTVEDDGYFAYDNIGYIVTDLCFRKHLGVSWQELLDAYVLAPLGLRHTTAYMSEAAGTGDLALPHLWDGQRFRVIPPKTDQLMHAAGGLVTTAHDAGRWLRVILGGGQLEGEQIFPGVVIAEVLRHQVDADLSFWEFKRVGYGLGWFDGSRRGERVVHHFGGYPGAQAHLSLMPERDIGVAALVNGGGSGAYKLPHIVAAYVYDLLLGRPDALEAARAAVALAAGEAREAAQDRRVRWESLAILKKRPVGMGHVSTAYTGTYQNSRFGTVFVSPSPGPCLWVDWGAREGDLISIGDDAFLADWEPGLSPDTLRFEFDDDGIATRFTWDDDVFVATNLGSE